MKSFVRFFAVSAFAALISVPVAFAQSQEAATFNVDQPLQVGTKILQPGIYAIRLLPTFADRTKVQVTSPDQQTIYATVLTVPHLLSPKDETDHPTFVYYPAADGAPAALRTWYATIAGSMGGHDIVYEETRAKQLARLTKSTVVSYTGDQMADLDKTELHVVTPEETIQPYVITAPTMTSSTETTTTTTTSEAPVQVAEARPVEMPQTASNIPLIALLGLMTLGGAIAVRVVRQA